MKERDVFTDPILTDIYNCLIDGWRISSKPNLIKRQALTLIRQILLHRTLLYYKAPKWFILSLSSDETQRLYTLLKAKYDRLGQTKSEEEIKQAIEILNEYFDKVVETQINKEAHNG